MSSFLPSGVALADRVRSALGRSPPETEREELVVTEPFTGDRIGTVPNCRPTDVAAAFDRAESAQTEWAERPRGERAEALLEFHDLVLSARSDLLDLVQCEAGKARTDAFEEVLDVAQTADHYAASVDRYLAPESKGGIVPFYTDAEVHKDPVGVVGLISPWNYPLTLSVSDALPALLAGNAVVVKPAEQTPFTALAVVDLLHDAGVPEEVVQVVTGEGERVGPSLVEASDYVMFTGSTEAGRSVAEQAGRCLTDCSLELGGKNPMIVLDDADLTAAAKGARKGAFASAGQLCIAIERIYVQEDVYDPFVSELVERTADLELGTTLDYGPDVGSLVSEDHLEKVSRHVEDARERGATVAVGGQHRPDVGPYFFEPTVLTDLPSDAVAATEETFGPVVSVTPVTDADEAVERANDTEYGLNAAVYGPPKRARRVAERIRCGTVNVNDPYLATWAAIEAPMGGMGDSGIGRRHGREGIEKFTEKKTVARNRGPPLYQPRWAPGAAYERAMVAMLRAIESIRSRR